MGPKQILIVFNDTNAARLAHQLLDAGVYTLHLADNCVAARSVIQEQQLDGILLGSPPQDRCLPPLDHLKESGNDPAVIALLDANEQERYLACHQEGALDCLMAPFSAEHLMKSIERCLAIKSLEREKRDFISMLSHDLKNPLTAAIGSIDLVRDKRLGPVNREQISYLTSAIESCNEVVSMIDNLLDIHRFEAGKITFHNTPAKLSDLVQKVVSGFSGMLHHDQIQLQLELEDTLPLLMLDRNKFARVTANLLANAAKFTPPGGTISVRCYCGVSEQSKLAVMLSIKDTGKGIATVDLPVIFDRFMQARNHSGRGSGGCGLGLAFCKMVVEMYGGSISVYSQEGVGSEFIITLPVPETEKEVA